MMTKTGILILTNPNKFVRYLPRLQKEIKNTLYIQFLTKNHYTCLTNSSLSKNVINGPMFSSSVLNLYRNSLNANNIDVRVLLGNIRNSKTSTIDTKKPVEVIYFDDVLNIDEVQGFITNCITNRSSDCQTITLGKQEDDSGDIKFDDGSTEIYDNVVLGGTFDRLHVGHKMLLSEAVLRCRKKLTIGVTNTEMIKSKKLWELIEPCDTRINSVRDFLEDIDPGLEYNIVSIEDMFGPTKDDPTFQMLIVSTETMSGGAKVNEVRTKNGLNPLIVHSVNLLANPNQDEIEEDKISSSNNRIRLLGRLLRKPEDRPVLPKWPYIIGLSGGIGSGKSSICKRLEDLGAAHINCDEVGHNIYKKGTQSYNKIINVFGTNILDKNKEISRKALADIIFNEKEARTKLNNIMWPAILEESKKMALEFFKKGRQVIILEAAVLLEAGWINHCHEIWACIIPPQEAINRLQGRNNMTEEEAKARISSQPPNLKHVENANVIFCTLWKPEFTQKQVERAWKELNDRLELYTIKRNQFV